MSSFSIYTFYILFGRTVIINKSIYKENIVVTKREAIETFLKIRQV